MRLFAGRDRTFDAGSLLVPTLRVVTQAWDALRPVRSENVIALPYNRGQKKRDAERPSLALPRGAWEREKP